MPVGNSSPVAEPGSRLRELGLVLPEAPMPLGALAPGQRKREAQIPANGQQDDLRFELPPLEQTGN